MPSLSLLRTWPGWKAKMSLLSADLSPAQGGPRNPFTFNRFAGAEKLRNGCSIPLWPLPESGPRHLVIMPTECDRWGLAARRVGLRAGEGGNGLLAGLDAGACRAALALPPEYPGPLGVVSIQGKHITPSGITRALRDFIVHQRHPPPNTSPYSGAAAYISGWGIAYQGEDSGCQKISQGTLTIRGTKAFHAARGLFMAIQALGSYSTHILSLGICRLLDSGRS
jgi:hypothetical protein